MAHVALGVIAFFGMFSLADFIVRSDGSQMDPNNMLPLEELFVAMVAFPFITIPVAFLLTSRRQEAASISFVTHALFAFHQIWKKSVWDSIVHPDSELIATEFFIISHIVWVVVSLAIFVLSGDEGNVKTN
jgi:hypothetical protein